MKHSKTFLCLTGFLLVIVSFTYGQTNVSGGIYSNTTWSKVNSPYIVTDTIVVFPGVTLTIQPGVTVKFANQIRIELRQARMIALGNKTDSISFTSNSTSPAPGIWDAVYLNGGSMISRFNYCDFRYANKGVNSTLADSLIVRNSEFNSNQNGVYFVDNTLSNTGLLLIDSSDFRNNQTCGANLNAALTSALVSNSTFSNNVLGLYAGYFSSRANNNTFVSNQTGISGSYITIDHTTITHNQTGFYSASENKLMNSIIDSNSVTGISANGDSILHCYIKYNGIGVDAAISVILENDIEYNTTNVMDNVGWGGSVVTGNTIRHGTTGIANVSESFTITKNTIEDHTIGIDLRNSGSYISCNKICNNSTYDLKYTAPGNINATHNYWCTPDSTSTRTVIYDGYTNINYGLVAFMPLDSTCVASWPFSPSCSAHFVLRPDSTHPGNYTATNYASGTGSLHYDWNWGDGSPHDTTATPSHTYAGPGLMNICLTMRDSIGCSSTQCDSLTVARLGNWTAGTHTTVNVVKPGILASVQEKSFASAIKVYPNPGTGMVWFSLSESMVKGEVTVFDIYGKLVSRTALNQNEQKVDLSAEAKGIYFYRVLSENKLIGSGKLVIE
jgi:hypothetical protein